MDKYIESALIWLDNYLLMPDMLDANQLHPSYVIDKLKPLVDVCPFVPDTRPLVHLTVNPYPKAMDATRVFSMTSLSTPRQLDGLSGTLNLDDMADDGKYVVLKVKGTVHQLVTERWLLDVVRPYVGKNVFNDYEGLEALTYTKEQEVICFVKSTTKTEVVMIRNT